MLAYRWWIVLLSFFTLAISRGMQATFTVFYPVLADTFHWSRASTAGIFSLGIIVDGIASPLTGVLVDRFGPRKVLPLGGILLAGGFFLAAGTTSQWHLYLGYGVVASVGMSFIGMVPHGAVLSRWFLRQRGTAIGIGYSGAAIGILIFAPLSQYLISLVGWRQAFVVLGMMAVVLVIPATPFYRWPRPDEVEKVPSEPVTRGPRSNGLSAQEWTTAKALRNLQFWLLFGSRILAAMGVQAVVTHQVAHVAAVGYSQMTAAAIFGLMGVFSIAGRILFGVISDFTRRENAFTLNVGIAVLGVVALMLVRGPGSLGLLYTYSILYGLAYGSRAILYSAISADLFSGASFGSIYGFFNVSIGIGGAIGSWFGGFVFDQTGSYLLSFALGIAALIAADLSLLLAFRHRHGTYKT